MPDVEAEFIKTIAHLVLRQDSMITVLDKNKSAIDLLNYMLNYFDFQKFIHKYPTFYNTLYDKCNEFIQSVNCSVELKELCTQVLAFF